MLAEAQERASLGDRGTGSEDCNRAAVESKSVCAPQHAMFVNYWCGEPSPPFQGVSFESEEPFGSLALCLLLLAQPCLRAV